MRKKMLGHRPCGDLNSRPYGWTFQRAFRLHHRDLMVHTPVNQTLRKSITKRKNMYTYSVCWLGIAIDRLKIIKYLVYRKKLRNVYVVGFFMHLPFRELSIAG